MSANTAVAGGGLADQKPAAEEKNYLTNGYDLKSWLLTVDHKRIAILYLISISVFFALGGLMAVLIRMELITPAGDLMQSDTYNKVFTMHGVMMIFFFLIPSIPAVLGNFLLPLMLGAKDVAFPRLNLLSWYVFMLGAVLAPAQSPTGSPGSIKGTLTVPPLTAKSIAGVTVTLAETMMIWNSEVPTTSVVGMPSR